jgi:hypothetical protein
MKVLATILVLISANLVAGFESPAVPQTVSSRFMAFCVDGDGPLNEWANTRNEAYIAGRDHERTARGHRWEVWVQQGETAAREPSCALVTDGNRPETLKVENTCGRCVKFFVSRTSSDGSVKSREFTVGPNKSRHFRKLAATRLTVDAERECPE